MDFILLLIGIDKMLQCEVLQMAFGGGAGRFGEMVWLKIIQHWPNSDSLHSKYY